MTAVKQESTGWRDERFSRRHRLWGYDVPFVDLDFPVIEYDRALPRALVEYKAAGGRQVAWEDLRRSASIGALRELAESARIPFLVVYYRRRPWRFTAHAGNARAADALIGFAATLEAPTIRVSGPIGSKLDPELDLGEADYVRLLYWLRDRPVPRGILENIAAAEGLDECERCGNAVEAFELPAAGPVYCGACLKAPG